MNTLQLTAIMDKISHNTHFLGVLPCDQSMTIINTHPSELPGEHWLAVYFTREGTACFFDSFGNPPDDERFPYTIKNFLVTNSTNTLYSARRVQDFTTDVCGQHCVFFLHQLARGHGYNDVMRQYSDDYIKNDRMVLLFVKKLRMSGRNEKTFPCIQCVQTCNSFACLFK